MTGDQIRSHKCKSLKSKNTFNGDVCIVRAHTELMLNTLWRRAATQSKNYVISFFFTYHVSLITNKNPVNLLHSFLI